MPGTNAGSNSSMSPSIQATMSPVVAARLFHIASPLPLRAPTSGSTSASCTTRAPALRATSAVPSELALSITTTSSTSPLWPTQRSRIASTIAPTVPATSSVGITTDTLVPDAARRAASAPGSKLAPVKVRSSSHSSRVTRES